jgi:hypothetical protein
VTEENPVGAVAGLAQQLLRDVQLVLEFLVSRPQLFLELSDRQVRPDPCNHFLCLERLVDEVNGAELETAHLVACVGQGREEHDRRVAGPRVGLQSLAGREAVDVRHHHVEQDQVGYHSLRNGDAVLAAPRGQQAIAPAVEGLIENLEVGGVVVHQQDLRCVVSVCVHSRDSFPGHALVRPIRPPGHRRAVRAPRSRSSSPAG